ncbi:MAG: YlqD family protein [Peptococcaceae bacterium]|nr:YlqD family protein [Peptococcaceae bacterium]
MRPITVKVIVTEQLKEKLFFDLQHALQRVEGDLQQIEYQSIKVQNDIDKINSQRATAIRNQLDTEKQKRLDARRELLEKLKAIAALEIGQEQVHSTVKSIFEVNIGDTWQHAVEIVLKDDRIVEIR